MKRIVMALALTLLTSGGAWAFSVQTLDTNTPRGAKFADPDAKLDGGGSDSGLSFHMNGGGGPNLGRGVDPITTDPNLPHQSRSGWDYYNNFGR